MQRSRGLLRKSIWQSVPLGQCGLLVSPHVPAALTPSTFSLYTNTRLPEARFKVDWAAEGSIRITADGG